MGASVMVKRYGERYYFTIRESEDGEFVKYTDFQDVERNLESMRFVAESHKDMYEDAKYEEARAHLELRQWRSLVDKLEKVIYALWFILTIIGMVELYKYMF